ncbi:MAG: hypothetical protein H7239_05670 [Flavobacterium sp.]|nr:hypothetical protein [Flavobacterium sp.]
MKKLIFTAFLLFALVLGAQSQVASKNALGLRLGSNDGFGGEISYQRELSKSNRLEFDLGFRNSKNVDAFKAVGLYQWVWNIDKGFNWYAGLGAGIGSFSYSYYDGNKNQKNTGTFGLLAGDIGIEYNFDVPIQLALDYRPEFYLNANDYRSTNFGSDIALSIRYRFN